MTVEERFDRLLGAMLQGGKPTERKSTSTDQASSEAPSACSSETQTPPDVLEDASR